MRILAPLKEVDMEKNKGPKEDPETHATPSGSQTRSRNSLDQPVEGEDSGYTEVQYTQYVPDEHDHRKEFEDHRTAEERLPWRTKPKKPEINKAS